MHNTKGPRTEHECASVNKMCPFQKPSAKCMMASCLIHVQDMLVRVRDV